MIDCAVSDPLSQVGDAPSGSDRVCVNALATGSATPLLGIPHAQEIEKKSEVSPRGLGGRGGHLFYFFGSSLMPQIRRTD
jgi:hypothetical protein